MRISIDDYGEMDLSQSIHFSATENSNLANLVVGDKEYTVSVDDLFAAALALKELKSMRQE